MAVIELQSQVNGQGDAAADLLLRPLLMDAVSGGDSSLGVVGLGLVIPRQGHRVPPRGDDRAAHKIPKRV